MGYTLKKKHRANIYYDFNTKYTHSSLTKNCEIEPTTTLRRELYFSIAMIIKDILDKRPNLERTIANKSNKNLNFIELEKLVAKGCEKENMEDNIDKLKEVIQSIDSENKCECWPELYSEYLKNSIKWSYFFNKDIYETVMVCDFDLNKENNIEQIFENDIVNGNAQEKYIIFIIGPGGSGKTFALQSQFIKEKNKWDPKEVSQSIPFYLNYKLQKTEKSFSQFKKELETKINAIINLKGKRVHFFLDGMEEWSQSSPILNFFLNKNEFQEWGKGSKIYISLRNNRFRDGFKLKLLGFKQKEYFIQPFDFNRNSPIKNLANLTENSMKCLKEKMESINIKRLPRTVFMVLILIKSFKNL